MSMERCLYTTLDDLLDTRLVTLSKYLSDDEMVEIIQGGYADRIYEPELFDTKKFYKEYDKRNKDTLKDAFLTRIPKLIRSWVIDTLKKSVGNPLGDTHVKIYVNTYPYELTDTEKDMYVGVLSKTLSEDRAEIVLISSPMEEISTKWLADHHVRLAIMYLGEQWLNHHFKDESGVRIPNTELLIPLLITKKVPNWQQLITTDNIEGVTYDEFLCGVFAARIGVNTAGAGVWAALFLKTEDFKP